MSERDFKGIWIPREIWLDDRLNALEKVIYAEIDSLSGYELKCIKSNATLAEFCQCSESKVSKAITKLIDLGYVEQVSFDGRRRTLQSCLAYFTRQDSKIYDADEHNMPASNTYSSSKSNTNNKKKVKKEKFVPPSVEEICAYCKEKGYDSLVDAQYFFEYYDALGWKNSKGKSIASWKGTVVTWAKKAKDRKREESGFGELNNYLNKDGSQNWDAHNNISSTEFIYRLKSNAPTFVKGLEVGAAFEMLYERYPRQQDKFTSAKAFFEFVKGCSKQELLNLIISLDAYLKLQKDQGNNWNYCVSFSKFIYETQYGAFEKYNYDVLIDGKYYETKEDYVQAVIDGEIEMYCLPRSCITL